MVIDLQPKDISNILKYKASGTVSIFEMKGFYRCYGNDAYIVSNDILMSNLGIQFMQIDSLDVPYHNLNVTQYARVVKDLLLMLRYRVELYEEIGANKFMLKAKGILGNLDDFEDIITGSVELAELSTIMCAWPINGTLPGTENKISLVFCNSQDLRIIISELDDTPNFTLSEKCFVSFQPRECLLINKNINNSMNQFKKYETAIQKAQIKTILLEELEDDVEKCKNRVRKLFHKKFADLNLSTFSWISLHALLSHMQLLKDTQYEGVFSVVQHRQDAAHMYLCNTVLRSLDIFSIGGELDSCLAVPGPSATLHDHLNKCRSQPGKRLIREWIRQPLFNCRLIEERLDVVEVLCNSAIIRQALHDDFLRRVPDIKLLARKLVQRKANLQDCFRLYQFVCLLGKINSLFEELEGDLEGKLFASFNELIIQPIRHSIAEFERFKTLIESTIDFTYLRENGHYRIKPDLDENLSEIATQINGLDKKAQMQSDKMANKLRVEVKLESKTDIGFFFRITLKSESLLRHLPDVQILDTAKGGGVRFQTKTLDVINDEFKQLSQQYETGQAELSKSVIKTCAGYANAMSVLADRIAILDVLTSFAVVASSSPIQYTRPKVLEKGTNVLELINCRHPVIEQLEGIQFIPNDLLMGTNAECGRFMILTGANMGGKSTYLKATALTILMAQMGSFVPCSSATFSIIDGIYTRVGAGDFQSKGISTFMAEMMDCATILEKATSNSLILIDELGRGTSTYDGFGLAWAIAEEIITRIGCFSLFATHFHELSKIEEKYPKKAKNYKMETLCEDGQLTILYRIMPGVADRSFGLNIAQMVGFSNEIMEDARNILQQLEAEETPSQNEPTVLL